MTAELIQFDRHRDLRRGHLYRQKSVPRGPDRDGTAPRMVEQQVARISHLLAELEELTRSSTDVPASTLTLARSGVEKARLMILPWTANDEIECDPQPEVDDESIERMYRDINGDR